VLRGLLFGGSAGVSLSHWRHFVCRW